jgi:N-carbamoyl-L-amino-acid hydrolase
MPGWQRKAVFARELAKPCRHVPLTFQREPNAILCLAEQQCRLSRKRRMKRAWRSSAHRINPEFADETSRRSRGGASGAQYRRLPSGEITMHNLGVDVGPSAIPTFATSAPDTMHNLWRRYVPAGGCPLRDGISHNVKEHSAAKVFAGANLLLQVVLQRAQRMD